MTEPNLRPDPDNARIHNRRNRAMIADSLARFGAVRPIISGPDGVVYAGNATYQEAQARGLRMVEIPIDGETLYVMRAEHLTPDELREYGLIDNRSAELAEWDTDELRRRLDSGDDLESMWNVEELADLLEPESPAGDPQPDEPEAGHTDPDDVPDPPAEPVTQPGDLWVLGDHRLVCGDATDRETVALLMHGDVADMVWTDPPYTVDIAAKNRHLDSIDGVESSGRVTVPMDNDALTEAELARLLESAVDLAWDFSRAGAVWQVCSPPGNTFATFGVILRRRGIWRQTIIWVKNNSTFAPLGVDYHWQHEPIFHGWKPGAKHRQSDDRTQTTVWQIDRPAKSPDHPTMKPVALVDRALQNHTVPGDIVLDLFGGSGTTLISAQGLHRKARLVELSPRYCDVIVERWQDFTGDTAERIVQREGQ